MADLSAQLNGIATRMAHCQGANAVYISRDAIRRIHQLHESGMKLNAIARVLDQEGFPTPRGGKAWHGQTVKRALTYRP